MKPQVSKNLFNLLHDEVEKSPEKKAEEGIKYYQKL